MPQPQKPNPKQMIRSFLVAGLIPVIAFSVIEASYGIMWGLAAGMVFGVGEILYEWRTRGRVDPMTWGGNGLILVLGGVSLLSQEGIWFKLQPAILEAFFALGLAASALLGKPLLVALTQKQMRAMHGGGSPGAPAPELHPFMIQALGGMTWRLALFFGLHACLAAWAALSWSTAAWATLKGAGFTVSLLIYGVAESRIFRYKLSLQQRKTNDSGFPRPGPSSGR